MRKDSVAKIRILVAGLILAFGVCIAPAAAFDFTEWDALLKRNVAPVTIDDIRLNGVDYRKIKADPAFPRLLGGLKTVSLAEFQSEPERLAFWINTYNILAVKMVVDHYPVESIKDVGSLFSPVWKRDAGEVAGKMRTLNEVEHEILRRMGDPRIHVAIVCASVSCPDLPDFAFTPEQLEAQLDGRMVAFLENSGKGMRVDKDKVYLSSIFKWFAEDFEAAGGVRRFLSRYLSLDKAEVLNHPETKIRYLDYNWMLNERGKS